MFTDDIALTAITHFETVRARYPLWPATLVIAVAIQSTWRIGGAQAFATYEEAQIGRMFLEQLFLYDSTSKAFHFDEAFQRTHPQVMA